MRQNATEEKLKRKSDMKNKVINLIFIALLVFVILSGAARCIFFPIDINEYENRYAVKLSKLNISSFLDGSFQKSAEGALSDQLPFSEELKRAYNDFNSGFIKLASSLIIGGENNRYIKIGDYNLIGDYILFNPSVKEHLVVPLQLRAKLYNDIFALYEKTDFYLYYIEKDTDINFENNEKSDAFEVLSENVNLPSENMARFEIKSFEDYKKYFYKTDHHWNKDGSYKGYTEVLKLLLPDEEAKVKKGEKAFEESFSGSKTKTDKTSGYSEEFSAYTYDFPEMEIHINGFLSEDYGGEGADYAHFYGPDAGEIIFDTKNEEKENVLIIGESFDNAILKLLASHFNKTFSVDLRYYKAYMGKDFSLSSYLTENDIDKVLFIGNIDYFIGSDFEVRN